jgi:hypothetical protein
MINPQDRNIKKALGKRRGGKNKAYHGTDLNEVKP